MGAAGGGLCSRRSDLAGMGKACGLIKALLSCDLRMELFIGCLANDPLFLGSARDAFCGLALHVATALRISPPGDAALLHNAYSADAQSA